MSREVITLQLGSYANYVGAHYWNIGDDVLGLTTLHESAPIASQIFSESTFRVSETCKGAETYNPRLVLFDTAGSLGAVRRDGTLGGHEGEESHGDVGGPAGMWDGPVIACHSDPVQPSTFLMQIGEEDEDEDEEGDYEEDEEEPVPGRRRADAKTGAGTDEGGMAEDEGPNPLEEAAQQLDSPGGVRYWTDFLKTVLHPRSTHEVRGVWSGSENWGGYGHGAGVLGGEAKEEAMDRIRFFAEECDRMQGFQVIAEDLGGWGRVTSDLLAELHQDYGKSSVLLFSVRPPSDNGGAKGETPGREGPIWSHLNPCLSMAGLREDVSLYVPLSTPPPPPLDSQRALLRWDPTRPFHSSAVCAAALDTATLPYRLNPAAAAGIPGQSASPPLGSTDMEELLQLLTRRRSSSSMCVAALHASLPAPAARSAHEIQQLSDERLKDGAEDEGAAPRRRRPLGRSMAMSEGHGSSGSPGLEAESVVLRGARGPSGLPSSCSHAAEALDAMLLQERKQQRSFRHRAIAMQPLPIPLPFPSIFTPAVSALGGILQPGQVASAVPSRSHVRSTPILTRLQHTAASRAPLQACLDDFKVTRKTTAGAAAVSTWGYDREELAEVEEGMMSLISGMPTMMGIGSDDEDSDFGEVDMSE